MLARSVAGVTAPPVVSMTAALLAGVTVATGRRDWCWGVPEVEEPGEEGCRG